MSRSKHSIIQKLSACQYHSKENCCIYIFSVQYVMTPCEYFAKCFHKCLAGPGTNDERLIQLVVNHCEVIAIKVHGIFLARFY